MEKVENSPPPTPSLTHRLRQKLRELNHAHQVCVKEQAEVDQKIRKITESITALPIRQTQMQSVVHELLHKDDGLEAKLSTLDQELEALRAKEKENSHHDIRLKILSEVCLVEEKDIIEDGLDVKVAEIRRLIAALEEQRATVLSQRAEIQVKIAAARESCTAESIAAEREQLQTALDQELSRQKQIAANRTTARNTMEECQRLLEDLEERQTLLTYAEKNGLTLETKTTDELIRVCRTHQEKIAAKNAAVDARSYESSTSSDESDEEESYSTCHCSECQRQGSSVDSVHYFRVLEARRRQDGLTVAGALNTKQRRQTRQEHGSNGWCQHW